jgi:hypothetical protein
MQVIRHTVLRPLGAQFDPPLSSTTTNNPNICARQTIRQHGFVFLMQHGSRMARGHETSQQDDTHLLGWCQQAQVAPTPFCGLEEIEPAPVASIQLGQGAMSTADYSIHSHFGTWCTSTTESCWAWDLILLNMTAACLRSNGRTAISGALPPCPDLGLYSFPSPPPPTGVAV